jgi:LCP family protein required for cell wall assembly
MLARTGSTETTLECPRGDMKRVLICICAVLLAGSLLPACGGSSQPVDSSTDTPAPAATTAATIELAGTTEPSSATPSSSPTATATATPSPTPVPTPLPVPEGVISVMLLGCDRLPGQVDWRTDTMIYVRIDPANKIVGMLSIPRDLWVYIPDHGYNRLNTADYLGESEGYPGGGPALLNETLLHNLGISFDHYIRINFDGFKQVIDILGGIDVDVECAVELWGADPENPGEWIQIGYVPAGMQHMEGLQALRYAQCRYNTPAFDRDLRQQRVLFAVRNRVTELGIAGLIPRALELLVTMREMVQTDLGPTGITSLAQLVPEIPLSNVNKANITTSMAPQWTTPEGAWVMLPDREKIAAVVMSMLDPPSEKVNLLKEEAARIVVRNGTPAAGWGRQIAERLQQRGFDIIEFSPADKSDYAETLIFSYADKPYTVQNLQTYLDVKDENVRHEPGGSSEVDVVVILGDDFHDACP